MTSEEYKFIKLLEGKINEINQTVSDGPKKPIKLLKLMTKKQKINDKIKLEYVEIIDVINDFDINKKWSIFQ